MSGGVARPPAPCFAGENRHFWPVPSPVGSLVVLATFFGLCIAFFNIAHQKTGLPGYISTTVPNLQVFLGVILKTLWLDVWGVVF